MTLLSKDMKIFKGARSPYIQRRSQTWWLHIVKYSFQTN